MMLYREEYYDEFTDKKWVTDIAIRKNRNWPVWTVELMFDKSNQKILRIRKMIERRWLLKFKNKKC